MSRILLGVSHPRFSIEARNVIRFFVDHLNLRHQNIEQPIADAVAALLRISPHELAVETNSRKPVQVFDKTAADLFADFKGAALSENSQALLVLHLLNESELPEAMRASFNGEIISGITNEAEADWIRDNGGLMLHITTNRAHVKATALNDSDICIEINREPLPEITLQAFATLIAQKFSEQPEEIPEAA